MGLHPDTAFGCALHFLFGGLRERHALWPCMPFILFVPLRLGAMGLRPDTAFGCALHLLFGGLGPEARRLAGLHPRLHGTMVDEQAVKIGIQIRLGDDSILGQIASNREVRVQKE